jgi:hypothetical protein
MGIFAWTLGLPLLPLRGVIWIGEIIQQRVDQELHDPRVARRQLEEVGEAARRGELPPEKEAQIERQITRRLASPSGAVSDLEPEG